MRIPRSGLKRRRGNAGSGVQTLPIFILDNMFRPNQAPIVAVIAVVMILIAIVPIYIAQRLTSSDQR
jgi:putative spermidine/putrescine transport system permease protein